MREFPDGQREKIAAIIAKLSPLLEKEKTEGLSDKAEINALYNELLVEARRYNWFDGEQKRELLAWFLIEAMAKKSKNILDTWPRPPLDTSRLDVKMTIDGVEVPVREVFELLGEQWQAMHDNFGAHVEDQARILIKRRHQSLYNQLEKLSSIIDDAGIKMKESFPTHWLSSTNECEDLAD